MTLAASCEGMGLNPMSFSDQHGSIVLERLRYQRETGRFCDVAIVVKDRQFSAHRNILASCSPYFDSIFKSTKVTKEQVHVNCPSPTSFELLLNYMYSGCVVVDRSTVSELLRLANNFLITKLKNYCAEYLDRYLDAANCLSIKLLASRYNLPSLLKAASEYFDVNINRCLLESVDILRYTMPQLTKVIDDPKYQNVIHPDVHLKLIVRWVGDDVAAREGYFRALLAGVPIGSVSDHALEFVLDYSDLCKLSQNSRYVLLHTLQESGMSLEKYQPQLTSLSQQLGSQVLDAVEANSYDDYDSGGENMEDEEYDETPVEGQPSTSQVLETTYDDDGTEKPRLRLKISLGGRRRDSKHKLYPKVFNNVLAKKRGRPPKEVPENDILPMMDDDELDGVYATSSLNNGAVTYTDDDFLDPEDVEPGEDNPVEGGTYNCGFCRFATILDEDLEKHRARVHNRNTLYMCQLCDFECNWSKMFYEHCRESHWTQAPYQCDQCSFVAPNRIQDLLAHRLQHTEDRFFKCIDCTFRARSRTQLWAHERMHSSLDERPVHCEECGRGFISDTALQMHQATHDQPRPFICEDCGFATNNGDHLALHRRQHTGDVFYCHIEGCDYSSPKKSQLAAHLRTHMAVRAHMCKICGRGFIEKSHLVRHERIHLEDKPFKCDLCEYASSRRDKLKEHILKHHNGNVNGTKGHRRRYRRARQLAALTAQAKLAPPEAMFRPIPAAESVSQWAENQAAFQPAFSPTNQHQQPVDGVEMHQHQSQHSAPQSQMHLQHPHQQDQMLGPHSDPNLHLHHQQQQQHMMPHQQQQSFSPQRAYSVTHQAAPLVPLSPGSMSLMNVHLGMGDSPMMGGDKHPLADPCATPLLITPSPRSPQSHSDLMMDNNTMLNGGNGTGHRPMSLPPYGQPQQTHQPASSSGGGTSASSSHMQQHHQWW